MTGTSEGMGVKGWQASVPGNLMVLGEHAVLHGRHALVCAVSPMMHLRMTPRDDRTVRIQSALGQDEADLSRLEVRPPFRFIWAAIQQAYPSLGFDLEIESGFSDEIGFGSSAAVTVGILGLLAAHAGQELDRHALFTQARSVIRSVQGRGSGADAAASVFGGLVLYRSDPLHIDPVPVTHPLTLLYSGYKETTPVVIEKVEALRQAQPRLVEGLYDLMDRSVLAAAEAVRAGDWPTVGRLLNMNQGFMDALGVNDRTLSELVYFLRDQPSILGAKISGSGLGDCVLGLGALSAVEHPYTAIPAAISEEGLRIEEI